MENKPKFLEKIRAGQLCLGTCITFSDSAITEALTGAFDFVWIEMEHNPLSLEAVQGHIMATKGTDTTPLVRVAWNDPVLIKPVLDIGAAGIIVPMVRTAEEARRAVAACLYPPHGIRGFGPRRPCDYGRIGGPDYCRKANESVMIIVQLEHIDAVRNIDQILAVPGITSIVIGPNDLAGSMGHSGDPTHPDVVRAIETIVSRALSSRVIVGLGSECTYDGLPKWIDKGIQWLSLGADFVLLTQAADQLTAQLRNHTHSVSRST